jgi:hypothetical protein
VEVGLAPATLRKEGAPWKTLLYAATLIPPPTRSRVTRDTLLSLNGLTCQETQPCRNDQPARARLVEVLAQARVTRDSQCTLPDESITHGGSPSDGRLLDLGKTLSWAR